MLDNLEKNYMFVLPYVLLFKESQVKNMTVTIN